MARPPKCKIINICLDHNKFICNSNSDEFISLTPEELQVIKLKDLDNLWCIEWAMKMWISKSTFANIYNKAHQKITQAIIKWYNIQFKC